MNYNGQAITYDSIGNPLTYRNGMTFSWFGRQMESANVNGTAITYKYNADGLRTEKKVGSTVSKYEYTGDKLFYEKRGNLEFHYRYDVFGNLASITRVNADGTSFSLYTVCNSRGDVEELRRSTGELFARYVYDSWGNILHIYDANGAEITSTANLAVQNPFRYRGYYYDNETGLYYLQSRYYDSVTHRFLNADGYVSTGTGILGHNMFAYCNNNPICLSDSEGNRPIDSLSIQSETEEQRKMSFVYMSYSEHSKKGTTNPSNRNKHEQGQSRKNRDNHNEKGDARRKNHSNKRHFVYGDYSTDLSFNAIPTESLLNGIVVVGSIVAIAYILVNDVTGVGIVDDVAIIPFAKTIWDVLT